MPELVLRRHPDEDHSDITECQRIIEAQQREIETLRYQIRTYISSSNNDDANNRPPSELSSPGSEFSTPLSCGGRLSGDAERVDIDRDRFETLCCKLQRMHSKLMKRNLQTRDARAQITALQQQLQFAREMNTQLMARASALDLELQRETAAKEQAIEKAAMALMQCDALKARAETSDARASSEMRAQQSKTQDLERTIHGLEQENARQQAEIAALAGDRQELALRLQSIFDKERACGGQCGALRQQLVALQEEVPRLNHAIELQTQRLSTQQQSLQALTAENSQLVLDLQRARDEHTLHAAHLLQASLVLEQQLKTAKHLEHSARQQVRQLEEQRAMGAEELEMLRMKDELRLKQLCTYGDDYAQLHAAYRELVRASSGMELSRRDLRSELMNSRKKIVVLQSSLETLDEEIQKLSKAVAARWSRDQSVGRALREYGRRNRVLETAVGVMKRQLRAVADSLRASERRKSQALTQTSELKRDLVVEKCQRADLLHQCGELERCLASCHASATETQQRARLLQSENNLLQDAVKQLCAYSHELVSSQQSLQRELKHLEVTGKSEPAVFG